MDGPLVGSDAGDHGGVDGHVRMAADEQGPGRGRYIMRADDVDLGVEAPERVGHEGRDDRVREAEMRIAFGRSVQSLGRFDHGRLLVHGSSRCFFFGSLLSFRNEWCRAMTECVSLVGCCGRRGGMNSGSSPRNRLMLAVHLLGWRWVDTRGTWRWVSVSDSESVSDSLVCGKWDGNERDRIRGGSG